MQHRTLLVTATACALSLVALTGCTSDDDATAPAPSSTTTVPATDPDADPALVGECVDGQAIVSGSATDAPFTLADGCDTVYVLTSGATLDLGPTQHLVFEGTGNTVTVTGDPEVAGGDENSVTTR